MKVTMVQIGISTRCNSHCYFCFREELKRAGMKEGNIDFPVKGIESILNQGIRDIQLCCNRGEAIFHPEITTIIDMIKESGSRFEMNTNGDNFDTNWWYDLGQKMTEGDQIIFALDGLKKAHEFYRKTSWISAFNNMKAFISGGGNAIWQMILFRHNEKQVEMIKELSRAVGCSRTWIINSRYYNDVYKRPIREFNKTKEDILHSTSPENITCRFFKGERVYIDVYGSVWPCCFVKCHFGFDKRAYPNNPITKRFRKEKDFINVLNTPLDEIVEKSEVFNFTFDHMYDSSIHIEDLRDNPKEGCLLKWPEYAINFACQLYCGDNPEIDTKNRRDIENWS